MTHTSRRENSPDDRKGMIPLSVAAQRLGVSRAAAFTMLTRGIIDGEFTGTRWMVRQDSLPEPLTVGSPPPAA